MKGRRAGFWVLRGLAVCGIVLVIWTVWLVFLVAPWEAPPADQRSSVQRYPSLPQWPEDVLAIDSPAADLVELAEETIATGHGLLDCPVSLRDGIWLLREGGEARTVRVSDGHLRAAIPAGDGQAQLWSPRVGQARLTWRDAAFLEITTACDATLQTGVAQVRGIVVGADGEQLVTRSGWGDLRVRGCGGLAVRPVGGQFVARVPSGPCALRVDRDGDGTRARGDAVSIDLLPNAWQSGVVLTAPSEEPAPLTTRAVAPGEDERRRAFEAWRATRP